MLPSVAAVGIAACMFDTAPLWLCGGITAYVLYVRNTYDPVVVKWNNVRRG